jgi:hypothetical protein
MDDLRFVETYRISVQTLKIWGITDPDLIADTVTAYWYATQVRGKPSCKQQLRWSLGDARKKSSRMGKPGGRQIKDALPAAHSVCTDTLTQQREKGVVRQAIGREGLDLVLKAVRSPLRRLLVRGVMAGETIAEIARQLGRSRFTIRYQWSKCKAICRQLIAW